MYYILYRIIFIVQYWLIPSFVILFVSTCTHTNIHIWTCTHTHTNIRIWTCTHTHTLTNIHTYTCITGRWRDFRNYLQTISWWVTEKERVGMFVTLSIFDFWSIYSSNIYIYIYVTGSAKTSLKDQNIIWRYDRK